MKKEERQETEYLVTVKVLNVLTRYGKMGVKTVIIQIHIKSQLLLHKAILNYNIFIVQ